MILSVEYGRASESVVKQESLSYGGEDFALVWDSFVKPAYFMSGKLYRYR